MELEEPSGPAADSIPGYSIVREIHRGGQGVVYQALQKTTRRKVAIKVMHEGPFAGSHDKARFEREVQVLAALKHPNIVAIHESGMAAGSFYFVMDYISGQPLDVYMAGRQRTVRDTLLLFQKICEAVNAAHLRGVIHRDLKPGNIRVDPEGQPQILDFGLAKVPHGQVGGESRSITQTGQFVGSLPWASPEQAESAPEKIDIRTDVYSLGVILYQMLTGKFPYEVAGGFREVLERIIHCEPVRPRTLRREIDDEVETIVLKCLSKESGRRYQSAGELARDVGHYLAGEPIEAKRDSTLYVLRKSLSRYRTLVGAGAAIVLILIGALAVSLTLWKRTERAYARERDQQEISLRRAQEAEEARDRAREEKAKSDRLLYAEYLADADRHLTEARFTGALQSLADCPSGQRHWEWGWLTRRADVESLPPRRYPNATNDSISPDGRLLAVSSDDGKVRVWSLATDTLAQTLWAGEERVRELVFSTDGRWLAASDADRRIRVWDTGSGQLIRKIDAPGCVKRGLAVSPDGRLVAAGASDGVLRLWNLGTGAEAAEPLQHTDAVSWCTFSADGRFLGSMTRQTDWQCSLFVWDLRTRAMHQVASEIQLQRPAFAPLGNVLVYAPRANTIAMFDAENRVQLKAAVTPTPTRMLNALAISPDGRYAAAGGNNARVYLWETGPGGSVHTVGDHDSQVHSLSFTADSRHIASFGRDCALRFWPVSAQDRMPRTTIREEGGAIESVAFSPCGRFIVSGAFHPRDRGLVRIRDVATGTLVREMHVPHAINSVVLHPDGRRVIAGTWAGTVHVWDATDGRELWQAKLGDAQARAVAIGPDGRLMVTATVIDRDLPNPGFIWEIDTGRRLCQLGGHERFDAVSAVFSLDGKRVYLGCGPVIHVWKTGTGQHLQELRLPAYRSAWNLIRTPDGRHLLAGTLDGKVHVVDSQNGNVVRSFRAHFDDGGTNGLALSPDGRRLATAGGTLLKVWDTTSWRELMTLNEHTGMIRTLAFSPDGRSLVSAGHDGRIIVRAAYSWNEADYPGGPETPANDRIRQYGRHYRQQQPPGIAYTAEEHPSTQAAMSDR